MSLAVLLLLAALGVPAPPAFGLPYARPATPEADLAQLRQEIAAGRPDALAWHHKIKTYLALGELPAAPELVGLLAATFPGDPAFQEARMMFLSLEGKHPEAIALGEEILRRHPGYATIRVNLARVYLDSQDRARGLNHLIAALEQGPIRVEDWELLLTALGVIGKQPVEPEVVVAKLREKIAENPGRPSLRYLLMVVLTRYGRYAEAREILAADPGLADHPELKLFAVHTAEAASP
jgi:tetratricopeptide (TPR) repeat protein